MFLFFLLLFLLLALLTLFLFLLVLLLYLFSLFLVLVLVVSKPNTFLAFLITYSLTLVFLIYSDVFKIKIFSSILHNPFLLMLSSREKLNNNFSKQNIFTNLYKINQFKTRWVRCRFYFKTHLNYSKDVLHFKS